MNILFYIAFLLLPFAFISPGSFGAGHRYFIIIVAAVLSSVASKNLYLSGFMLYLALWVIACFSMAAVGIIPDYIISDSFVVLLSVFTGVTIYTALLSIDIKKETLMNAICAVAIFQGFVGLLQMWSIDPLFYLFSKIMPVTPDALPKTNPIGTLGNNNFWAAFIAISIPFFFRAGWKWCVLPMIALVVSANTSTAVFSLAVGLAILSKKWWVVASVIVVALAYAFFVDSRPVYLSKRWSKWGELINRWRYSWVSIIFGHGPGSHWRLSYEPTLPAYMEKLRLAKEYIYPHSEWLHALQQYGIIGVSFIIGFVGNTIKSRDRLFTASAIIILVNCIGNHPLHGSSAPLSQTAFLIIVIFAGLKKYGRLSDI